MVPATLLFVFWDREIIAVALQRRAFTARDTLLTAAVLQAYSYGLFSVGAFTFLQRFFYSVHDFRTPLLSALLVSVVDVGLSLWLRTTPLRVRGLALANSAAFTVGLLHLLAAARRRLGGLDGRFLLDTFRRMAVSLVPFTAYLIGFGLLTRGVWESGSSLRSLGILAGRRPGGRRDAAGYVLADPNRDAARHAARKEREEVKIRVLPAAAALLFTALLPMAAQPAAGPPPEERWREVLRYGIESEVLQVIGRIKSSGEDSLNPELLQTFRGTSNPAVAAAVLDLFAQAEVRDAEAPALERLADPDGDPRMLVPCMRYLAAIRSAAAAAPLAGFLDSSDELASAAIQALAAVGQHSSGEPLLARLRDPEYSPGLKSQLLLALGSLKYEPALEDLIAVVSNPDEERVRRMYAASALGEIGDSRAIPALRELFAAQDSLLRAYAAAALAGFESVGGGSGPAGWAARRQRAGAAGRGQGPGPEGRAEIGGDPDLQGALRP